MMFCCQSLFLFIFICISVTPSRPHQLFARYGQPECKHSGRRSQRVPSKGADKREDQENGGKARKRASEGEKLRGGRCPTSCLQDVTPVYVVLGLFPLFGFPPSLDEHLCWGIRTMSLSLRQRKNASSVRAFSAELSPPSSRV